MKIKIKPLLPAALSLLAIFGSSNAASAQATVDSRIVFCGPVTDRKTHQTTYQILSILPDGSRLTQLSPSGGAYPSWSPDKKYVAYHLSTTLENTIYVLDVKTGRRFAVVQAEGGPDWTPDGRSILFAGTIEAGSGLWLVSVNPANAAVGTPVLLKDGEYAFPKFSPDGRRIAFCRNGIVGTFDLTTQAEIMFPWSSYSPAWRPDGSKIAFGGVVCYSPTGPCFYEIVVASSDGSGWSDGTGWKPVTSLKSLSYFPAWSPDGSELAFCSNVSGSRALYKTTIGSGTVTLLYLGAEPGACWTP